MWTAIGKALLKAGAWCFTHRDELEAVIEAIRKAKEQKA